MDSQGEQIHVVQDQRLQRSTPPIFTYNVDFKIFLQSVNFRGFDYMWISLKYFRKVNTSGHCDFKGRYMKY